MLADEGDDHPATVAVVLRATKRDMGHLAGGTGTAHGLAHEPPVSALRVVDNGSSPLLGSALPAGATRAGVSEPILGY